MPKRITKTVYTFAELKEMYGKKKISSEAFEKAHYWLADVNTSDEWYEYVYELWTNSLNQIGFNDVKISFSGFACQGDGACFTAKSIDIAKLTAFLAATIEPTSSIPYDGENEDFRGRIMYRIGNKPLFDYTRLNKVSDHFSLKVISTDHRYCHEGTCHVDVDYPWRSNSKKVDNLVTKFAADVERLRYSLCKAIYRDLEEEYECLRELEPCLDLAEVNDYTFTKNGEREG